MKENKRTMNLIIKSLLNIMNNPQATQVNRYIASQMIQNYQNIDYMTISEVAEYFHVSLSQISRFVRMIGFESYSEFRDSLMYHGNIERHMNIQRYKGITREQLKKDVIDETNYFFTHFDDLQLSQLINDLHRYKHIAFFGLLNSANVAKDIQMNLASQGLVAISYLELSDQLEYIKKADDQTLIVMISVSGNYVLDNDYTRYYKVHQILKNSPAKKVVVTKNEDVKHIEYIDDVILLPVYQNYYNHTLQFFIDLLTMYY